MMTAGSLWSLAARARAGVAAQLAENRRLRLVLAAGGVIIWINLTLALFDGVDARRARLGGLVDEAHRYELIIKETNWPQRQAAAEALVEQTQQRLWPAESEGIARADFQEWILRTARDSGLGRAQVRIERDLAPKAPPGMLPISAQLSADMSPNALVQFLSQIAGHQRVIVVTSLRVQKAPLPRVDMIVTTFTRAMPAKVASG
ncbi:MAG: hypothetical protein HYR63_23375 [Proteobacteria bacterium]|nr:hypothetical protein [Pseudomonadota bacterium]